MHAALSSKDRTHKAVHSIARENTQTRQSAVFADNRVAAVTQRKLQAMAASQSPRQYAFKVPSNNEIAHGAPIQRKMESNPANLTMTKIASAPTLSSFTTLPDVNVLINKETATSKPDDIPGMDDSEVRTVIADPSKSNKQVLTKMHLIRGKFSGPGSVNNLRLGTAYSNLHSADGHYRQVEQPISQFLQGGKSGTRAVDYHVNVGSSATPAYLSTRLTSAKKASTTAFVNNWCPSTFDCKATYYLESGATWSQSNTQSETIPLDLLT